MFIKNLTAQEVIPHREELLFLMNVGANSSFSQKMKPEFYNRKLEDMQKYLEDGTAFIPVAFHNGKIVGYLWAYPIGSPIGEKFHIAYLAVCPQFSGQGIGSALIEVAERESCSRGISKLELIVTADNRNAVEFYEKHLYKTDRLVMCKTVLPSE